MGDYYRIIKPGNVEIEMRALELDPLFYINHSDLLVAYYMGGDYQKVAEYADIIIPMKSMVGYGAQIGQTISLAADANIRLGRDDKAEGLIQTMTEIDSTQVPFIRNLIATTEKDTATLIKMLDDNNSSIFLDEFDKTLSLIAIGRYAEVAKIIENGYERRIPFYFDLVSYLYNNNISSPEIRKVLDKPEVKSLFKKIDEYKASTIKIDRM